MIWAQESIRESGHIAFKNQNEEIGEEVCLFFKEVIQLDNLPL